MTHGTARDDPGQHETHALKQNTKDLLNRIIANQLRNVWKPEIIARQSELEEHTHPPVQTELGRSCTLQYWIFSVLKES